MRILNENHISSILKDLLTAPSNVTPILHALEKALASFSAQTQSAEQLLIHQPHRVAIRTRDQNVTLTMPVSDTSKTAVKVVTVPQRGDIAGAITLYTPNGQLLAVLNALEITAFRTALATMVIFNRWMDTTKHHHILIFGAGRQAEWHLRLLLRLMHPSIISHVTVVNRSRGRLEDFTKNVLRDLVSKHPLIQFKTLSRIGEEEIRDVDARLRQADIICCCTPSREPLFTLQDLVKHDVGAPLRRRFVSLIGSYTPDMQEVDQSVIHAAEKIFVDSIDACLVESGELIRANLPRNRLIEIGELVSSSAHGDLREQAGLTLFKCVGLGVMDLAVSQALIELAERKQIGVTVDGF